MPNQLKRKAPALFTYSLSFALAEATPDRGNDESGEPKREVVLTCLQEGPGNEVDNRYYTRKAVEGLEKKIYTKRKIFADHLATDEARVAGDKMVNWWATVLTTWLAEKDGRAVRKVRLKVHEDWLWRRCLDAPGEIALSIEGRGQGEKGVVEGKEYTVIEDITYLSAIKFVPYPGNATMGADLVEGEAAQPQEETMDWSKVTLEDLRKNCPQIVTEMEQAVKAAAKAESDKAAGESAKKSADLDKALAESRKVLDGYRTKGEELAAQVATLQEKVKTAEEAKDGNAKALTEQFRQEMRDGFTEQAKIIESLRSENSALKTRLDEKEVRERLVAKDELIDRLLRESDLPEEAKTEVFRDDMRRLTERKSGDQVVTVEAQVRERIADRKKLCVGGPAHVTGNPPAMDPKLAEEAKPKNAIEEQVCIDEAFSRKYSRLYDMDLKPETVLVEWRKRQQEVKKA